MSMNAYQVYKKTQVSTASQGDLLIMLFDGAVKFANQARLMIEEKQYEQANQKLIRCQDILQELISSLNLDAGEIAENLYQLYSYIMEQLVEANVKKDITKLDEATQMLVELRDTWKQVVKKN